VNADRVGQLRIGTYQMDSEKLIGHPASGAVQVLDYTNVEPLPERLK